MNTIKREYELFQGHQYHTPEIEKLDARNKLGLLRKIIERGEI
jgi:hypothetical protein